MITPLTTSAESAPNELDLPASPGPGQAADTGWFREQVQPHEPALRDYLRRRFPQINDIDDVVQESFLRVCKARMAGTLRSVRGLLFAAARNRAYDEHRHRTVVPFEPLTEQTLSTVYTSEADGAAHAQLQQELAFLTAALEDLPDRCREILILRRIHGLPHKEIARRLSLTEHTIEKQVGIGLRKCVEYMRRHHVTRP